MQCYPGFILECVDEARVLLRIESVRCALRPISAGFRAKQDIRTRLANAAAGSCRAASANSTTLLHSPTHRKLRQLLTRIMPAIHTHAHSADGVAGEFICEMLREGCVGVSGCVPCSVTTHSSSRSRGILRRRPDISVCQITRCFDYLPSNRREYHSIHGW